MSGPSSASTQGWLTALGRRLAATGRRAVRGGRARLRDLRSLRGLPRQLERLQVTLQHEAFQRLKALPRYQEPGRLQAAGYKLYSQHEEDGMIAEVFRRLGAPSRYFVEVGVGDGLENNTLALLFQGWSGLWIEARSDTVAAVLGVIDARPGPLRLAIVEAVVTRDNVNDLLTQAGVPAEIDLLSLDIDGNDVHVLDRLTVVRPRLVVVEYNARFPAEVDWCMAYHEGPATKHGDCFGASLAHFERRLAARGYRLVGCDLCGVNAFFVREDLLDDHFAAPYTAAHHHEPPRYHLSPVVTGYPPSLATLAHALTPGPAGDR